MPRARPRKSSEGFSQAEYETLAEFRYHLALFCAGETTPRAEGLQARQYELLLAVSGLPKHKQPTIRGIATQLCLEHHTVGELADRLEGKKLLVRRSSRLDMRVVLLHLTAAGRAAPSRIVRFSFSQLRDEAPVLIQSLRRILEKEARA